MNHFAIIVSLAFPITVCTLIVSLRHRYNPVFAASENAWTQWWIEDCRYRAVLDNPDPGNPRTEGQSFAFTGSGIDENALCTTFLRCVLGQATPDYPTYWSAAASILAFIPTIVGLLSNSIDEIVAVADESLLLALSLALSSTVSFSTRFTNYESSPMFEYDPAYVVAAKRRILDLVARKLRHMESPHLRRWFQSDSFFLGGAVSALVACAGAVWYCVWRLTVHGCVVWSCPQKFHTALWVALSQILAVLGIASHSFSFDMYRIRLPEIRLNATAKITLPAHTVPRKPVLNYPPPLVTTTSRITVVLRCRRGGWKRWLVQTASSVISYGLYTFSTVVLASMTLISPVDAVLIMLAFSMSGGVGRLVGYWAKSSLRSGKTVVCFDIPEQHMNGVKEQLDNHVDWHNLSTELAKMK